MGEIRFRFAPAKALAAIHRMIAAQNGVDLHTLLKACYFADRAHLNKYGRPVFGATYKAMRFGPVPLEIYEMTKSDSIWLAELGLERFPWRQSGYRLYLHDNSPPDPSPLSASDLEEIDYGLTQSRALTFSERTKLTHGPDWQSAELGLMRYEDMLDETPDKRDKVDYLEETARFMRL